MTEKPSADKSADTDAKDLALPGKAVDLLEEAPAEAREWATLIIQRELSFFRGPLPPPEILGKYHQIDPAVSRELVEMAKRAQESIRQLRKDEQRHDHKTESRGQIFCAALALVALVGGVVLIVLGKTFFGGVLSLAPIIGLAAVYIKSEFRARKPREK